MVTLALKRRRHIHTNERGSTMFVVLMIVMVLSAVGTFAVANARLDVLTAGHARQRTLAAEMAQMGAQFALEEIGSAPQAYAMNLRNPVSTGETCKSLSGLELVTAVPQACFRLYLGDIENRTKKPVVIRPSATDPGTLGSMLLSTSSTPIGQPNGGFVVELTDPMKVDRPLPGQPLDDSKYLDITITSTGVFFVDDNRNDRVDFLTEAATAAYAQGRGHVLVGPIL